MPATLQNILLEIPIDKGLIREGGNEIKLTTLEGSWIKFDQVKLEGPGKAQADQHHQVYFRGIEAADYEIETENGRFQPLLIDMEHLEGTPELTVRLDKAIFTETIEPKGTPLKHPCRQWTFSVKAHTRFLSMVKQYSPERSFADHKKPLLLQGMWTPKWGQPTHAG